ncbi:MAG: FHA domain-containing protein [Solirubrobacterales bacterium]|nr:FHA domain-containing protein [Solirubrobacterales bacterium]
MLGPGASRQRLAAVLNAAYGDGLLSDATLAHRLDELLRSRVLDPQRLVGDLTVRRPQQALARITRRLAREAWPGGCEVLLALDWAGARAELLVGRHPACDVVLHDPTVSRRHARLRFRDGHWVLQDLDSTNGSRVNRRRVVRCRLEPGDQVRLGSQRLLVD